MSHFLLYSRTVTVIIQSSGTSLLASQPTYQMHLPDYRSAVISSIPDVFLHFTFLVTFTTVPFSASLFIHHSPPSLLITMHVRVSSWVSIYIHQVKVLCLSFNELFFHSTIFSLSLFTLFPHLSHLFFLFAFCTSFQYSLMFFSYISKFSAKILSYLPLQFFLFSLATLLHSTVYCLFFFFTCSETFL